MENVKQGSEPVLYVEKLTAGYTRGSSVIKDLSLAVGVGEMVGLIGPNGAGKSTLLKAMQGLLSGSQGLVVLPAQYAYIPEMPALYEELTLWEHMEIAAMSRGLSRREFAEKADELLHQFHMEEVKHHFPGGFSKGMRQKVMVICAIITRPALYLIDEPFNGLDALAIRDLLAWLEQEKQRGASILLSTHVLETAQRICDRFIVLDEGEIAAEGTLLELKHTAHCEREDLFEIFLRLTKDQ